MPVVVIGASDSRASEASLIRAVRTFSSSVTAALHIVHVRPPKDEYRVDSLYGFREHWEALERSRAAEAAAILEKFRNLALRLGMIPAAVVELSGDPGQELCHYAEGVGADVLVLGTSCNSLFKRFFGGRVGAYCATHLKCCAVMAYSEQQGQQWGQGAGALSQERMLQTYAGLPLAPPAIAIGVPVLLQAPVVGEHA